MINEEKISQCIVDIYRLAYDLPIADFKQAAMNRFSELIKVDVGFWITRSEIETPFFDEDSFTYNLPEGVMQHYIEISSVSKTAQEISGYLFANLNKTYDVQEIIPEERFKNSDIYLIHCKKYDLEHAMVTMTLNPNSMIVNAFSFVRGESKQNFTKEEREIKQFIVPNLVEALRINLIKSINDDSKSKHSVRGIVDKHGKIIESEERFEDLMKEYEMLSDNTVDLNLLESKRFSEKNKVRMSNNDGLVYIEIIKAPIKDQLSKRKLAVCQLLCRGLSNKEIARELFISQDAVSNHMKEINKALNVTSRYQAIAVLSEQDLM
ncbi:response regulator transcription factor [Vibrio penaeicida]|uniref:HTH luxR-type domain-containing protein n=1 Tax=Vibrio penaeicida TaxID=104609 RepID=A0AAV5NVT6_9VIBR|nr:LuxR C-terminal-related transcriptional regulator [Vibrio penaeicida]RTZ21659.1 response regulator transcription factor [Vibrio penaeicida]GLQ74382.1 hypothetical protein GCM10007932_37430 [Vibrio penaeicida]